MRPEFYMDLKDRVIERGYAVVLDSVIWRAANLGFV